MVRQESAIVQLQFYSDYFELEETMNGGKCIYTVRFLTGKVLLQLYCGGLAFCDPCPSHGGQRSQVK